MSASPVDRLESADRLAAVRHELRTPLTGLVGLTALLLDTPLDHEQRALVAAMQAAGAHLATLVDEVMDPEGGLPVTERIHADDVELATLVSTVVALFTSQATAKKISLRAELDPDLPHRVRIDGTRLRQVLVNLVSNAVKFTDVGSVTVRASRLDPTRLRFDVVDTGVGLAAGETTAIRPAGSGIGLVISRRLVSLMGGTIDGRSDASGTSFELVLPVAPVCAGGTAAGSHDEGRKVLVADDDPVSQQVLTGLIRRLGHAVHGVTTGEQVLATWRSGHYDIIVLDCHLPDLDGREVAARIRRVERRSGRRVPIVAVTAGPSASDRVRCLEAGMDGYLAKPVDVRELADLVARLTAPARPRRSPR
jgi:two-component system, sensor histidine kinase